MSKTRDRRRKDKRAAGEIAEVTDINYGKTPEFPPKPLLIIGVIIWGIRPDPEKPKVIPEGIGGQFVFQQKDILDTCQTFQITDPELLKGRECHVLRYDDPKDGREHMKFIKWKQEIIVDTSPSA